MSMRRYANWLRWPLLPPLSLAAAYLAASAVALADSAGGLMVYAAAFASGVGYVWAALLVAHAVAPFHKRLATTVLGLFVLGDMAVVHLIMPPDLFDAMASEKGINVLLGLLRMDHYGDVPNGGALLVAGVAVGLAAAVWKLFSPKSQPHDS